MEKKTEIKVSFADLLLSLYQRKKFRSDPANNGKLEASGYRKFIKVREPSAWQAICGRGGLSATRHSLR